MEKIKRLFWIASSKEDLEEFPKEIKNTILFALGLAQKGEKHASAKPFKGFKGTSVMEIVQRGENATFRVLYAIKLEHAVYVLHSFQKKSKQGIKTPKQDVDLIYSRYKRALAHHEEFKKNKGKEDVI